MDKMSEKAKEKIKKLLYINVFNTTDHNEYLKHFNPFVSADEEYEIPEYHPSGEKNEFQEIFPLAKKYNIFFDTNVRLPKRFASKYSRINGLLQLFLNEFHYLYNINPSYNQNFNSPENLFNFVLRCAYIRLSQKAEKHLLHDFFDCERYYINYNYIKSFINTAKEINAALKKSSNNPNDHSEKNPQKCNVGIYRDDKSSIKVEDNLVYCCFGFILIDMLLEGNYEENTIFFDLIDIQQKLTLDIDYDLLEKIKKQKENNSNAGKKSGKVRAEPKDKGYKIWRKKGLSQYKTKVALSYYDQLKKENNINDNTIRKWFTDYRKLDKEERNNVQ